MKKMKLANAVEAVYPNGNGTFTAAATILKGQLLKFSSGNLTPTTGATDVAIAVALDGAAKDAIVPAAILGSFTGTVLVRAAGEIAKGEQITATGTATAAATDVIIGRALDAATAVGDMINVAHQVGQIK